MKHDTRQAFNRPTRRGEHGFTLLETLVAMAILLLVMGSATSILLQFSHTQSLTWNRSDMHGAVRSATELLQQEVGQAGRIALGPGLTITSAIVPVLDANNNPLPQAVPVTSNAHLFLNERLVIGTGDTEETVTVTALNGSTSFSAAFANPHPLPASGGIPVEVRGGFASGIVPTNMANGSTGTRLKLFGDINGDGSMVYVEYECDVAARRLTRNMMPFTAAAKPAVTASQVLLSNVVANPPAGAPMPCFVYEQKTVSGTTFVINVAITLTSESQTPDRVAGVQSETKALLNVAPRNVYEVWQLANMGMTNRVQPMPPSVANLLP